MNTVNDFNQGDKVLYIPMHANGDRKHKDCERGVVSSKNHMYVFVRYLRKDGTLPQNGVATDPLGLVKL